MRLFFVICLLIASITAALPNGRQKRHFSYIRDLMTSAVFGRQINIRSPQVSMAGTGYKLYRIPGYDNIFIKALPKSPVREFMFPKMKPVNLKAFGSVIGTKSTNNTLEAMKVVHNLLSSGILYGQHNKVLKDSIVPMFQALEIVNLKKKTGTETVPIVEPKEPALTEVIEPYEAKVNQQVPFVPTYLYNRLQSNSPVMLYTAQNNPGMRVVETIEMKPELPPFNRKRIEKVIMLGTDPYGMAPVQAIYPFPTHPFVDISFRRAEVNVKNKSGFPFILPQEIGSVAKFHLGPQHFKDLSIHHNVTPSKSHAINPLPSPLHKSPHLDVDNVNAPKKNVSPNSHSVSQVHAITELDDKIEIFQTLGPIPPQYITDTINNGLPVGSKDKLADKTNCATNVSSRDAVSNGIIPSYVYEHQDNPNIATVKLADKVKINEKVKTNSNVKTPDDFYYVPPIINSDAPIGSDTTVKEDGVLTNQVTEKIQNVVNDSDTNSSTDVPMKNSLKKNEQRTTSFKDNPIVVSDVTYYVYHQKNADGSSISVRGNTNGVSVDIKENNKGRGDIPDE